MSRPRSRTRDGAVRQERFRRDASADSFELERPDHDRFVRELVGNPVVGLDLSQSNDLELRLLLVRLEVDRAVDHVLHGLEGLVVVHASLEGDRGHDLRLTEAVHEPLEEVHRVPLVCLGDRGAEGQVREPEVGILLLEFLVELAHDLVDVLEVRRAVHPPDVLLLHRFGGLERRRAVDPADEAELVVLDERRQDGRDVLRDVDRQLRRRDDDGGDALPQALRDEVEERDLFPDERGTDEEDVRIEGDAPVEQVVETRGPRLDTVRLLLDGDGLFRLRLSGRGRDAGLDGALAHLEFLFLLYVLRLNSSSRSRSRCSHASSWASRSRSFMPGVLVARPSRAFPSSSSALSWTSDSRSSSSFARSSRLRFSSFSRLISLCRFDCISATFFSRDARLFSCRLTSSAFDPAAASFIFASLKSSAYFFVLSSRPRWASSTEEAWRSISAARCRNAASWSAIVFSRETNSVSRSSNERRWPWNCLSIRVAFS